MHGRQRSAQQARVARFAAADERIAHRAGKRPATAFGYKFVRFGGFGMLMRIYTYPNSSTAGQAQLTVSSDDDERVVKTTG